MSDKKPPYFPPPPIAPAKVAIFARMPPAVFPSIMGAFGIGLAWRAYAETFAKEPVISEMILGAVSLLFLFALLGYLAKLVRRPSVIADDLRVLPGRAGVTAGSLCIALFAATLVPYAPEIARIVLGLAISTQLGLAVLIIWVFASGPPEQRQVTPVWHLSFVGFILLPLSAIPLGFLALAQILFLGTVLAAFLIYAISLGQVIRRDPPPPLRPLLAIHLAPVSLFATVSLLFDYPQIALASASLATLLLAVLVVKARYLTAAGFSPLWGAFTFPLAAYTGMLLMLGGRGLGPLYGDVARIAGVCLLVAASGLIGYILFRVLKMWAKGTLAPKTNAATA